MDTKPRLERAVPLDLIDPHKFDETATARELRCLEPFPATIFLVVLELLFLGGHPAGLVHGVRLLLRLRILGRGLGEGGGELAIFT